MTDLRVLRYFVAVADHGSLSRAAAQVLITQPSLSRQIRALEHSLSVALFVRDGGPLRLSPAGHKFLPVARDLLRRHATAIATTRHDAGAAPLTLTVAATSTTVLEVIAPFIAHTDLHGLVLLAREEPPETAYRSIGNGDADLAMTNEPAPAPYASRLIIDFPIYAYVAPHHPWADKHIISIEELTRVPLIVSPASGTTKVLQLMSALQLPATVAYQTPVPQIAQALAAAGHGVAVLSDDPRFDLHELPIHGPNGLLTVPMYASWEANHYAASHIDRCLRLLHQFCRLHLPKRY